MTYELKTEEFTAVSSLPASERYSHFLSKVVVNQEIWTLKAPAGFVLYGTEENKEIIPLWPHPEFAEAVKNTEWKNCVPYVIHLNDFLVKWLPGMKRDGRMAGVFPTSQGKGIIVNPKALHLDLLQKLKKKKH